MLHSIPRRCVSVRIIALIVVVSAIAGSAVGALTDPASAHADALCDQMRAQYGSHWPCISVPTNTFNPTPNAPAAPTTGTTGSGAGGPQVGSNSGPGPGEGNGTPIVPVPGVATPTGSVPSQVLVPSPTTSAMGAPSTFPRGWGYTPAGFCLLGHNDDGGCTGAGVAQQCSHGARGAAIASGIAGAMVGAPEVGIAGGLIGGCAAGIANGMP